MRTKRIEQTSKHLTPNRFNICFYASSIGSIFIWTSYKALLINDNWKVCPAFSMMAK